MPRVLVFGLVMSLWLAQPFGAAAQTPRAGAPPAASSNLGLDASDCQAGDAIAQEEQQTNTTARRFPETDTPAGNFGRTLQTDGIAKTTGYCENFPNFVIDFIDNDQMDAVNKAADAYLGGSQPPVAVIAQSLTPPLRSGIQQSEQLGGGPPNNTPYRSQMTTGTPPAQQMRQTTTTRTTNPGPKTTLQSSATAVAPGSAKTVLQGAIDKTNRNPALYGKTPVGAYFLWVNVPGHWEAGPTHVYSGQPKLVAGSKGPNPFKLAKGYVTSINGAGGATTYVFVFTYLQMSTGQVLVQQADTENVLTLSTKPIP